MDLSKSLEEIGKYFNEILGYLLPGLTIVCLVIFFLDPNQFPNYFDLADVNILLLLFLSYVCGYIVYGLSLTIEKIKRKIKIISQDDDLIKKRISKQEDYRLSLEELHRLIPDLNSESLKFNDLRNIIMSYVPEIDQKIYTFMFRSDLFKHTQDIFLIISLWGFIAYISKPIFNNTLLFNVNGINIFLILILFFLQFPLNEGKKRFLGIAYKIQFNIFLAKIHPIKYENK